MAVDTLFSTKYPNNQSVVSGTYTVFKDDVTILCDTSTAPVTINLLQIPSNGGYTKQGNWSTQYKLYVVDFAQNSSVNNITIVAPAGFKINAASSQVINNNGGSLIVQIVSNLDYIAEGALSGVAGNLPYFVAQKNLTVLGTTYFPQQTTPTQYNTIRYGAVASAYDLKFEAGVMVNSFNLATGIWTCPATGYYNISCFIYYQIGLDANSVVDGSGNYWMTTPAPSGVFSLSSLGKAGIGILDNLAYIPQGLVVANYVTVTQNSSDVLIQASLLSVPFVAGKQYQVQVLNQTNHDVIGLGLGAGHIGNPRIIFSGQKIA